MPRKSEVKFTTDDIRLIVHIAARWAELTELGAHGGGTQAAAWREAGDMPRIAEAITAALTGEALDATDIRKGLRPGDGGVLRALVPIARDAKEAAALRDLAKRITARTGQKKTHTNPDGSVVTVTARTISIKPARRRRQ